MSRLIIIGILLILASATPLCAHGVTVAFAEIKIDAEQVFFRLHLPALDSDQLFHIDADGNGILDASELKSAAERFHAYLARNVKVLQDGRETAGTFSALELWMDPNGTPFVETTARFRISPGGLQHLALVCDLLRDVAPEYQTVAWITVAGRTEQFVFEKGGRYEVSFATSGRGRFQALLQFIQMGIMHIFTGYDHLAFLLGVVLIGGSFRALVKIVTSFTVAHSITLALAAFDIVVLPSRIVEAGIALSIMYIAIENIFFQSFDRRWIVTFFFGLVHGFGFASALREVHLTHELLGTALFSFNAGVEIGQIAIVALLLPALWYLQKQRYNTVVVRVCSMTIFFLGSFWFWQRIR